MHQDCNFPFTYAAIPQPKSGFFFNVLFGTFFTVCAHFFANLPDLSAPDQPETQLQYELDRNRTPTIHQSSESPHIQSSFSRTTNLQCHNLYQSLITKASPGIIKNLIVDFWTGDNLI